MKLIPWLVAVLAALSGRAAWALNIQPYEAASFAQAQAQGQVTALQFHSGWCPICVLQERGLKDLREGKALDGVTVFVADFLKEAELRQRYKVTTFATLVIFHGSAEKARATGEFQAEKLKQFFDKAL